MDHQDPYRICTHVVGNPVSDNPASALRPICFLFGNDDDHTSCIFRLAPIFNQMKESLRSTLEILKENQITNDLVKLITVILDDESAEDEVENHLRASGRNYSDLYLVAAQMALTVLLKSLNIVPTIYLGHRSSELSCAFLNGVLSPEQVILVAHHGVQKHYHSKCLKSPSESWLTGHKLTQGKSLTPDLLTKLLSHPFNHNEMKKHIPDNAISVIIGSHKFLRDTSPTHLNLFESSDSNHARTNFFTSIGKLFTMGVPCHVPNLYSQVAYPVANGVPSISSLLEWDHHRTWWYHKHPEVSSNMINVTRFKFDLQDPADAYLADHCIDGRVLFPASGYLVIAWTMLTRAVTSANFAIEWKNVKIHRATIFSALTEIEFRTEFNIRTGSFTILEDGSVVATGIVRKADHNTTNYNEIFMEFVDQDGNRGHTEGQNSVNLNRSDIYKELRIRGYDYGPSFQCIENLLTDPTYGNLLWKTDLNEKVYKDEQSDCITCIPQFITFLDSMFQVPIISKDIRTLFLPTKIDHVYCDRNKILSWIENEKYKHKNQVQFSVPVAFDPAVGVTCAPGLHARGVTVTIANRNLGKPIHMKVTFVPNNESEAVEYNYKEDVEAYMKTVKFGLELLKATTGELPIEASVDLNDERNKILAVVKDVCDLKMLVPDQVPDPVMAIEEKLKGSNWHFLKDKLLGDVVFHERFCRPLLELSVENIPQNSVKILEVNPTPLTLGLIYLNYLSLYNMRKKITYTLMQPMDIEADLEVKESIDVIEMTSSFDRSEFAGKDITILQTFGRTLGPEVDTSALLTKMYDGHPVGAFLIIFAQNDAFSDTFLFRMLQRLDSDGIEARHSDIGFTWETETTMLVKAREAGFTFICKRSTTVSPVCGLLFRKCLMGQPVEQTVMNVTIDYTQWLDKFKTKVAELAFEHAGKRIWLHAKDSDLTGLEGFLPSIWQEENCYRVRCIITDSQLSTDSIDFLDEPWRQILKKDLVMNIQRDGTWGTHRTFELPPADHPKSLVPAKHSYIDMTTRGDLSSLRWFESEHKLNSIPMGSDGEVLVDVYYSSMNFRDIMLASGRITEEGYSGDFAQHDTSIGLEFAGKDPYRYRVMGMCVQKAIATTVVVDDPEFLWPVPDNWTLEEAATVPCVYSTAYYALIMRGKLVKGESVLIHAGSGGVGIAAINICMSMGCEVFTTVGTAEKKRYVLDLFPSLRSDHILNSRDTTFEEHIMILTNGRGVDVILNSLAEEKFMATLHCLADSGRFLEIGKFDMIRDTQLDMSFFASGKTFEGIGLNKLFISKCDQTQLSKTMMESKKLLKHLLSEGIRTGVVQPLKTTVFDKEHIEAAFRFMAGGKHIGKVLIKIRDENQGRNRPDLMTIPAIPRTMFDPSKSYVVVGGLGGIGLELAYWITKRGATKIVLTSRFGPREPYHFFALDRMKRAGVNVFISTRNVASYEDTLELIRDAKRLGPVGGVFNTALILKDALLADQTSKTFKEVCDAKVSGTINMDTVCRTECPDLDYFVCFSSLVSTVGNIGQSNYGFANNVMERVCEKRRADGLHGLATKWGGIGDVGWVVRATGRNDVVVFGSDLQRIPSVFSALNSFLSSNQAVVASMLTSKRDIQYTGKGQLLKSVKHILGVGNVPDMNVSLGNLGMDSLMSVEIKQMLENGYGINLSPQEIRGLTLTQIKELGSQEQDMNRGSEVKSFDAIQFKYDVDSYDLTEMYEPYVKVFMTEK